MDDLAAAGQAVATSLARAGEKALSFLLGPIVGIVLLGVGGDAGLAVFAAVLVGLAIGAEVDAGHEDARAIEQVADDDARPGDRDFRLGSGLGREREEAGEGEGAKRHEALRQRRLVAFLSMSSAALMTLLLTS